MDTRQPTPTRRFADTALIVLFLLAISLPLVDMVLGLDRTPNSEMRALAPAPTFALNAQALKELPTQIKNWAADHFGLRNFLIRQHGLMKVRGLGVSSSAQVVIGKQDPGATDPASGQWLFYAAYNTMNYSLHRKPFTFEQLETWRKVMEKRQAWLKTQGARYVFVIAPNSQSIYGEFLPDAFQGVTTQTRADQLINHLRAHTDLEVIDLRQALRAAKKANPGQRLFHRTDTHWNDLGSFHAYLDLVAKLKVHYPGITPLRWEQFDVVRKTTEGGDLSGVLGGRDFFLEDRFDMVPRPPFELRVARERHMESVLRSAASDPDKVRLLMFRDSFGEAMMSYLAEHFEKSLFVWTDQFEESHLLEMKPTLVITEIVERFLWREIDERDWMKPAGK